MPAQESFLVHDTSQIGAVRRRAVQLAEIEGLDQTECGRVAIAATELAGNLHRHARDGEVLIQAIRNGSTRGIELLSIDRGPGMANAEECLRDGYSTGSTPGTGLGAVRRLSNEFDLHSVVDVGTLVLSRIVHINGSKPKKAPLSWGAICQPLAGETACGDTWLLREQESDVALVLADGLGHGILAAEAAQAAAAAFNTHGFGPLTTYLQAANSDLRATRGAAVAAARFKLGSPQLNYAGLGNIAGFILSPNGTTRGLMSYNGTVGIDARTVKELEYDWPSDEVLVMHSDGLRSRWTIPIHSGLLMRHPAIIAGALYRDFRRVSDDVTVVVLKKAA